MDKVSSMDQSFLEKVNEAIEKSYENEQFGVDELAHEIGISRSQLHRKLHTLSGQSASQMIREFRLNKAMELLQNNVATASEISYKIGFSSPSYFNTCFHEYFGYSPGKVKQKKAGKTHWTNQNFRKVLFISLAVVAVVLTALYFFTLYPTSIESRREQPSEISIAIIPFKNLSADVENAHFADGMTDDLLNHLSAIQGLVVKSRQSSELYRNSDKSTPEIGEELDVAFILEGSVQRYNNNIRIIVQLIDTKNDDHIWSAKYDRELMDIFSIQSEMSQQIAHELNAALSPREIAQIEKAQTDNFEAYNMYQRGRYFWHLRTKEDLEKSLHYFNQAIDMDSTYALAYAGLADTYYIMVWWGWLPKDEGYPKAKMLLQRSLDYDPYLAEAYATQGSMACYLEHEWDDAESKLKQALKLNPNYATGHQYYSEYLDLTGQRAKALEQINIALQLNPLSIITCMQKSNYHYKYGEYHKALEYGLMGYDLDQSRLEDRWRMFKVNRKLGRDEEAISHLHKLWISDSSSMRYIPNSVDIYSRNGIDGLFRWATVIEEKTDPNNAVEIAENYAILGEKNLALEWLEKAALLKSVYLPKINNNVHFDELRSEPRFIALLEKMNLLD